MLTLALKSLMKSWMKFGRSVCLPGQGRNSGLPGTTLAWAVGGVITRFNNHKWRGWHKGPILLAQRAEFEVKAGTFWQD